MKWVIVFFCITTTNIDCMRLDNKVWAPSFEYPFYYPDESFCIEHAEGLAEGFFNEKKFEVEFACREVKSDWKPYVPHRRD